MKTIRGAAFLVGCLSLAASADAAESGFYVGADLAVIEASVGKSDGILVATPAIIATVLPESLRVDGSTTGWGAVLGYRINRYLAGELAYSDFGSVAIEETYDVSHLFPFPSDPIILTTNFTSRVYGPSVNLLGILPIADGFEAFARTGLLFADQELRLIPAAGFARTLADELWIIGAGIDVEVADRWSARFEYQSVDRLEGNDFTGPIRLERFVFGVSYDF